MVKPATAAVQGKSLPAVPCPTDELKAAISGVYCLAFDAYENLTSAIAHAKEIHEPSGAHFRPPMMMSLGELERSLDVMATYLESMGAKPRRAGRRPMRVMQSVDLPSGDRAELHL